MLTSEQIDQLAAVAERLYEQVPDVLKTIGKLGEQAAPARDEVSAVLQAGDYEEVRRAHVGALEEVLAVVSRLEPLTHTPAASRAPGPAPPTAGGHAVVPSRSAIRLDEAMVRFYTASACATASDLLEAYVETCKAFLGRRPGAKKIGKRTGIVFATALKEIVMLPGVETMVEGMRQIVTSPLDEDIARMREAKAQNARVAALRDAHGHLRDQMAVMGETVRIAVEGATDARASLEESRVTLAKALEARPPDSL